MEPTKPADLRTKSSTGAPAAELAGDLDCPSARLRRIQFGLLPSSTIAGCLSVIADRDERNKKVGITRTQDLFDARLGVPNKEQKCATCGGTGRGSFNRPSSCDGHFGHIALPAAIYHPLYVKSLPKILSSICLGCSRVLEKKKRKNDLQDIFDRESGDDEEDSENSGFRKPAPKRKVGAHASGRASRKRKRSEKSSEMNLFMQQLERGEWVDDSNVEQVKVEPMEIPETSVPGTPRLGQGKQRPSNDGQSGFCNYCGGPDGDRSKFPKIKRKLVSKLVNTRARVDTIQLVVDEKAGVLPTGFWDFVDGNPNGNHEKTRTLLPFEAFKILKRVSNDNWPISNPDAFIINHLLVSPNCNRIVMEDWSSTLQPRVLQRRSGQTNKLEAIVRKCNQIRQTYTNYNFDDTERDSEELQLLVARLFRACKVVEYRMTNGKEVEETGGALELKWMKANVLGKRSNYSARTVVNGDPWIRIEEIGFPKEFAQRLTVPEEINALNLRKWQKFVDDYMVSDNVSMPGAFILKQKGSHDRDLELLRTKSKDRHIKLGLGDKITRCLKDGDRVFANRNPSLHKHSFVTLKVKVHSLYTFSINPLICPPFDADFDGDSFHIFVPQSLESQAETQDLMTVNAQIISSQGGQPIIGLTQDTLVAGHLLTSGHVFINRNDMGQLSMWCSSQIPIPAIVKAPTKTGPLWTGKQLFGMTLPGGLNYGTPYWTGIPLGVTIPPEPIRNPEGEVRILDGDVLICQGGAKWLERSPNGVIRAICNHAGPVATVEHLDCLQALLHQWLLIRGFTVGLRDYYAAEGAEARKKMRMGIQKSLEKSNEASLSQALRLDRQYQHRKIFPVQGGICTSLAVEEHQGSFGLLLGDRNGTPRVAALQLAAIEKFQALAPDVENLVFGYMDKKNSLLAMLRSGSKGSKGKLTQQVGCLGLQLYKGERLLPIRRNNKLSYIQTSLEKGQIGVFSQTETETGLEGYWESRGIIQSSYIDGLNAREFFMDSMSSRCNALRQGVEEPNQILKNLMLFMRDMEIVYDGTVRLGSSQSIIQFQYGTGSRCSLDKDPEDQWPDSELAGEPVGTLAATSIAEPAYGVRMQSIHQAQMLGTGPIQLLKEVLMVRAKTKLKVSDGRSILRLSDGFGKERRALEIQRQLQRVTLEQITLTCAIEYVRLDKKMYVKSESGKYGPPVLRLSPWMGHIQLCKKTLDQNKLNKCSIVEILNSKHSSNVSEDSHEIYFSYSDHCISKVHRDVKGLCIWFFPVNPPESVVATNSVLYEEKMALLLESMKTIILPAVLSTTIRGSDNIEKVKIFWENSGAASRLLEGSTSQVAQLSSYQAKRRDLGELAIEVVVKAPKGAGKRGAAWMSLQDACIPVMDMIDWRRSTPYAIQEMYKSYGVEAARHVILKRLILAMKVMGKPVHQKHMMLVADTMTHCGDVSGLGSAGYREFCRHMSISAPFTEAAFQRPRKTFLDAAAGGASENIDGVFTSAVWGSRIPLGTGVAFQINPKVPQIRFQKWPRDPLELWDELRETNAVHTRPKSKPTEENFHVEKSMETQSLFQKSKQTKSYFDLEDLDLTEAFPDCKLAGILGKGKDLATIFQYGDEEECEDSGENLEDSTTSRANSNALSDSDGEDERESKKLNMMRTASILQDGTNEGCKGILGAVEDGIRAPALEGDERTGGKSQGSLENLEASTASPGNALLDSDEVDEHESLQKMNTTQEASILHDATNEGCIGRVEGVEERIKAPAMESDIRPGGKRVLQNLEEGTDIHDQPATKLLKKDVSPVIPRVEDDIAILNVNGSHKTIWSGCADVPVAEVVKMDSVHESSNVSSEASSQNTVALTTDEISGASTSFKGATNRVAGNISSFCGGGSKRESDDRSSVPSSKRIWPLNILGPFRSLFKLSSKNAQDTPLQEIGKPVHVRDSGRDDAGATGGISQSRREVLSECFDKQVSNLFHVKIGSRDPAPSEVVASSEAEQQITDEKKTLQRLLHDRCRVGDRVHADVEKMLVEDVLVHHPRREVKIGCGVDYIKVDYHPDYPTSKCFHIVRKDGSRTDFSYHKCLDSKLLKLCQSRLK